MASKEELSASKSWKGLEKARDFHTGNASLPPIFQVQRNLLQVSHYGLSANFSLFIRFINYGLNMHAWGAEALGIV